MSTNSKIICIYIVLMMMVSGCGRGIKISTAAGNGAGSWPQVGRDGYNSSSVTEAVHSGIDFERRINLRSMVGKSVVGHGNLIFAGTLKGFLEVRDINSGDKIGELKIKRPIIGAPLYDNGSLYFAVAKEGKTLFRYDFTRGKYSWKKHLGIIESSPVIQNGRLYVGTRNGVLFCLEAESGSNIWRYQADSELITDIAVTSDALFLASLDGVVTALNPENGDLLWRYVSDESMQSGLSSDGRIVYCPAVSGTLIALDAATGKVMWQHASNGSIYSIPSHSGGIVVFGNTAGEVYALHSDTGNVKWRFDAGSVVNTSPAIVGNQVYFGALNRKLFSIDLQTGDVFWGFDLPGKVVSNPIMISNRLVVPVENRYLYIFKLREGK